MSHPPATSPEAPQPSPRAGDLGEDALIERLRPLLDPSGRTGAEGLFDDAVVLGGDPRATVVTTDPSLDGVHFRRTWRRPREMGYRALARAASDVVAMGATPAWSAVAWIIPSDIPVAELEEMARGLAEAGAALGCPVRTADTSGGPGLGLVVTVGGLLDGAPLRRDGARGGDHVILTGSVGATAVAIGLLDDPGPGEASPHARSALERFLRPSVRVADGVTLREIGATAAIDVSDGVLRDARRLARASGVGMVLEAARIPVHPAVTGADARARALRAGEDYVLLATVPAEGLEALRRALPHAHVVGRVGSDPDGSVVGSAPGAPPAGEVHLVNPAGEWLELPQDGHEHFR
jgi:thiamine-monophosphate kinase